VNETTEPQPAEPTEPTEPTEPEEEGEKYDGGEVPPAEEPTGDE
jgi:hypothetical protein